MHLFDFLPTNVSQILLVLGLSFLIGLEREDEKFSRPSSYFFGGVRTFPLIALIGYVLILLSPDNLLLYATGFFVVGLFMVVSYWSKLKSAQHGVTSEMSGMITFLIGGAVAKELYWTAVTIGIVNVLLLQMKSYLESVVRKIRSHEITTLVKFLLLSAVILPVIPNLELTSFQINPYKTWLIVVAISSIFYATYLIENLFKVRQSIILSGICGGLYSSTATTVVLAKRAKGAKDIRPYVGAIVIATGMMYLRLAALLFFFNREIFETLGIWMVQLCFILVLIGLVWSKLGKRPTVEAKKEENLLAPGNPLEIQTALVFAGLFVLLIVLTKVALEYFGNSGIYSLAAIMGIIDVDPFVLGLTQTGGKFASVGVASIAILIAASMNNTAKGVYSIVFAGKRTGVEVLFLLLFISVVSFVPFILNSPL